MMTITTEEILAALEAATQKPTFPDGAFTVRELMARTGWAEERVRNALRLLKAEGRLEVVKPPREAISGAMLPTVAYIIKGA
jgi:hypothetical protein